MHSLLLQQLQFVSDAGNKNFLVYILCFSTIAYLYYHGYKKEAALLIFAAISNFLSMLLKYIYKQPRPVTANNNFGFDSYGFPSSHTLLYTVLFGFLIYLSFKLTSLPLPLRIVSVIISFYFISLVGISRVYLGQHYVWDVVGGYIFGLLYLAVVIMLDKKL